MVGQISEKYFFYEAYHSRFIETGLEDPDLF